MAVFSAVGNAAAFSLIEAANPVRGQ